MALGVTFRGDCGASCNTVIIIQIKKMYPWISSVTFCQEHDYRGLQRYAFMLYTSKNIFKLSKYKTKYP